MRRREWRRRKWGRREWRREWRRREWRRRKWRRRGPPEASILAMPTYQPKVWPSEIFAVMDRWTH